MSRQTAPTFAGLVQEFFTDYMVQQRALSPRTVASYRDTFVLLLGFAEEKLHLPAHGMTLADLCGRFLADFLDHLEVQRHNSVRSRNVRLAAVRAFLKFAARRDPANLGVIENALAVPMKRFERKMVGFLPREQMLAVIDVATDTWNPQLKTMSVSPHIVRHSTAMSLLQAGVDPCEIALWLGHESPSTTHMYVEADLAMKERALARLKQPEIKQARYRPPKALLEFLRGL
jgi:site-specific recombinase XerD